MPQQDFLQIIQQSPVFKELDLEMQKIILAASGKSLEEYANIFLRAEATLKKAKEEFLNKNEEIVKDFAVKVKDIKRTKLQSDEQKSRVADEAAEEELLKSIEAAASQ